VRDYDQLLTRRRSSPPISGPEGGGERAAGEMRSS
jgi:hypothetical protein